jgi:polar amino acid transport system substrate-binding protein
MARTALVARHPGQCELILRFFNNLGLLALLLLACHCLAAEKLSMDEPVDLDIVLPTENDWKTPVFGRGINHLMELTHLRYRVLAAPFTRGEVLMAQPNTCSGFASEEYARLNKSLWIGPILNLRIVVYAAPSIAEARSIDDLTGHSVGVMSNSYLSRWAERHGLKSAPVAIDNLNFSKLELGRIDYWLTYQQTAEAFVRRTHQSLPKLALTLDQLQIGMACSAGLKPEIIHQLRAAADTYFTTRGVAALDLD